MMRTVRHSGTGSAAAIPDLVIASIRVEFRADDVSGAFDGAGRAARAVVAAVRAQGVADGDVATTDVGLQAVETGPWEDRRFAGYSARESLTVHIRAIDTAAAVLQAATTAAGDAARIDSVRFAVSDATAPAAAARAAAFADARAKADQFAQLAGASLGAALTITDQPTSGPRDDIAVRSMAVDGQPADGPALAVGDRYVHAHVTVEWELV